MRLRISIELVPLRLDLGLAAVFFQNLNVGMGGVWESAHFERLMGFGDGLTTHI